MTIHTPSHRILISLLVLAAGLGASALAAQEGESESRRGHSGENNVLRLQVAQLTPRGDGDYWTDKEGTFTGSADDFEDLSLTVDYQRMAGQHVGVMLSGGYYEASTEQAYLEFVDGAGNDIVHTTGLQRAAFTAGLLVYPYGRGVVVVPYFGGGLGTYFWRLEEAGEFVDFTASPPRIFQPSPPFGDEEVTFGSFWVAGLEIPVGANWAVFAEGRLQRAEHELGGDFNGFGELDLSSTEVGVGASLSF